MRILVCCKYDGTNFKGWAKQVNKRTIQEEIENALSKFFNEEITIQASGRTDAGVHAYKQYFHFDVDGNKINFKRFIYSMNLMIGKEITILSARKVGNEFHARFSAKNKIYRYCLYIGKNDPFKNRFRYHYPFSFNFDLFQKSLKKFIGIHCFKNFTSKEIDERNFVREIYQIKVMKHGNDIDIIFSGNGFMRYMIRYIVGYCLWISQGKDNINTIDELLNTTERKIISKKASPEGLFLEDVCY